MDVSQLSQEQLAKLLREAEEAHGAYETQLGHSDENWPDWYAAFILARRYYRRHKARHVAAAGHRGAAGTGPAADEET